MKNKKVYILILIIAFSFALSIGASGFESESFDEQLNASGAETLWDTLDEDDINFLEKLGIKENDFDDVFNISIRKIADFFYELIRGEYDSVKETLPVLFVVITVSAAVNLFLIDSGRTSQITDFISSVISSVIILTSASGCVNDAASAIFSTSDFIVVLIPVLATIITVSGSPTLALTYNSMSFVAAQFAAYAADSFVRPLGQTILSLSIVSSVTNASDTVKIVDFIKKTVVFIFSFIATVFVTVLSLKGMLAASADNVTVRGIRFLIGNAVPIIGGVVSDAYLSIVGTLNLVKNTVGVFAVAAVSVINLPVIVECIVWIFSLNVLAVYSEVFSQFSLARLFRAVSSSLTLLAVLVLFELLVFLLSLGLVFLIKGSA